MAGRALSITYAADASRVLGAQKAIDAGHGQLEGSAKKTGGVFGDVFGNAIPLAAAAAGAAVLAFAASTVTAAAAENEAVNKSKVIFGDASASVLAFSDTSAGAFGISKAAALEAAGGFGAMFDTAGLAESAAASMSVEMVGLAGDLASFNNQDPSAMLERLRSGLAGEAEPLRQFGVFISAARVETEAYASGIAAAGEELTEAQKVQARYNLILDDTTKAQGDFARTLGDSLPNQIRVAKAELTDLAADLGQHLLPALIDLIESAREIVDTVGPFLEAAFEAVGDEASRLAEVVQAVSDSIEGLQDILPGVGDESKSFADHLGDAVGRAWELTKVIDVFPFNVLHDGLIVTSTKVEEVSDEMLALSGTMDRFSGGVSDAVSVLGRSFIPALEGSTLAAEEHTAAVEENAAAMRDQRQAALAATDAFFGILDAAQQVAEAQHEVNRLYDRGKEKSQAYDDASIALMESHFALEGAVISFDEKLFAAGETVKDVTGRIREQGRQFGIEKSVINGLIAEVREYSNALNAIPEHITTFVNVVAEGLTGAIGGIFAAEGFHGMVSGPTHILAGEAGPERVDITPQGEMAMVGARGGDGGGVTVNVYVAGSVHDVGDLTRKFRDELIRLQRRNVTTGIL